MIYFAAATVIFFYLGAAAILVDRAETHTAGAIVITLFPDNLSFS